MSDHAATAPFATPRLIGRAVTAADFHLLHALNGDPAAARTLTVDGLPTPPERTAAQLEGFVRHWREKGFGVRVLFERATGRFVGRAGLRCAPFEPGETELLYALLPAFWGRGLATEAGAALVAEALGPLGRESVIAFTLPNNRLSRRVMEKLGFAYERDGIHAGLPHVFYRLGAIDGPLGRSSVYTPDRTA